MSPISTNPTVDVEISLRKYISSREKTSREHMENGIPDYSFDLDIEMRRRIDAIPYMYKFFDYVMKSHMPVIRQELNLYCILTGPNQFPEIYEMGEECARRLGIGIPKIYIKYDPIINAAAFAFDDSEPVIYLNTGLIDAMTPGELKTIIGHECGHIHNNHVIYRVASDMILEHGRNVGAAVPIPGLGLLTSLFTAGVRVLFDDWSRCAEITCDRAATIVADDTKEAITALVKLRTGGVDVLDGFNLDEYIRQIAESQSTPGRLLEIASTHPLTQKRVLAARLFSNSETLYKWRPEWKTPDMDPKSKTVVDQECRKFISVFRNVKKSERVFQTTS